MKTLYVSDLDGTLFNKKKKISPYSADVINQCIKKGMDFTIATARMPYGCDYRLKDIQMKTPGILTNGVFIYEFSKQEFCFTETIETAAAKTGVQVIRDAGLSCFVYLFKAGTISIYYNDKSLEEQTQYYSMEQGGACLSCPDRYGGKAETGMRKAGQGFRHQLCMLSEYLQRPVLSGAVQ